MKAITKDYLVDFIFRQINKTIRLHRLSKKIDLPGEYYPTATDDEVLDFIRSIPYFDTRLKDFIIGNLVERTIIISQTWENEFIIKCRAWSESFEWLHGDDRFLSDSYLDKIKKEVSFLTLPY